MLTLYSNVALSIAGCQPNDNDNREEKLNDT